MNTMIKADGVIENGAVARRRQPNSANDNQKSTEILSESSPSRRLTTRCKNEVLYNNHDYMPEACDATVAIWIIDQVRRQGELASLNAREKIRTLFGRSSSFRFTSAKTEPTSSVKRLASDLSKGAVVFCSQTDRFVLKLPKENDVVHGDPTNI